MIREDTQVLPYEGELIDYCRGEPMCSPADDVNPNTLFNLLIGMIRASKKPSFFSADCVFSRMMQYYVFYSESGFK
jgi:hypothetical protein